MKVSGSTTPRMIPAYSSLANSGPMAKRKTAAAPAREGADRRLHRPRGQRPRACASRSARRRSRRSASRRRAHAASLDDAWRAARGGAVRAARRQLGDRRAAARRPEDAARPLPDGRPRDAALGAADDRRAPRAPHPRARRLSAPGSWARGRGAAHRRAAGDPAGRDRAAHQPLLRAGRPARQRHRLAGRSGLRRRGLARRSTRRGGRACSSALGPVVTAVAQDAPRPVRNRELALQRLAAKLAAGLRVPRRRRATRPTAASRARRLEAEAPRRRAQARPAPAAGHGDEYATDDFARATRSYG